jgi:DNA helicase-2/ATP-dependent DNA helicase PcrA
MPPDLSLTPEQLAILDFVATSRANLMISALAGTGKSTMLWLLDKAARVQPHLYLVFNAANAEEARAKFPSTTTVRTFNACGHRIWAAACAKNLSLNKRKISDIFKALTEEVSRIEAKEMWEVYDQVIEGVHLARSIGYIPSHLANADKRLCGAETLYTLMDSRPPALARTLIDSVLAESIRQAYEGTIDFPDQCYMPALFGGAYPRFPLVLVDEYQDLSPVQHAMIEKLCKSSRQIGVGDDAQSIYAFRGAKGGSMTHAKTKFEMAEMGLSVSFRCPWNIVRNVHWRVPHFQALREGGLVRMMKCLPRDVEGATVLCRNNAPLIHKAMLALQHGTSVNVSGTDISGRLVRQMAKLGPEELTRAQTLSAIDTWELEKLANSSKSARDTAECMRVFARKSPSLGSAIAYAKHMFEQSGEIKFMTGHKAKGLEWDHVYHLQPELCTDFGQDPNVKYVIDTRAREVLSYIV